MMGPSIEERRVSRPRVERKRALAVPSAPVREGDERKCCRGVERGITGLFKELHGGV